MFDNPTILEAVEKSSLVIRSTIDSHCEADQDFILGLIASFYQVFLAPLLPLFL